MGILNYNTTPQELIDSMVNGYENDLEENNRLIEFKNFINYFEMKWMKTKSTNRILSFHSQQKLTHKIKFLIIIFLGLLSILLCVQGM